MADSDRVAGIYSEVKYRFDKRSIQNLRKFKRDLMELKTNLRSVKQLTKGNVKLGFSAKNAKVTQQVAKASKETAKASKDEVKRSAQVWKTKEKILKNQAREARLAKQTAEAQSKANVNRAGKVWKQREQILKEQERQSQAEVKRAAQVWKTRQKITKEMSRQNKLEIDARKKSRDIADRQARAQSRLGRIAEGSEGRVSERSLRAAQRAQERYNRKLRDGVITMGHYNRASQQLVNSLRAQGKAAQKTSMSFNQLRTTVASLTGAYSAYAGAVGLGSVGGQFESARIMLETAVGAEEAGQTMQFLIDQSQRLGIAAEATAKGFARYSLAGKELGFTTAELQEQFLGIAEAGVVFGLRQDEMTGVLRAYL